jgi:hypothetical protein
MVRPAVAGARAHPAPVLDPPLLVVAHKLHEFTRHACDSESSHGESNCALCAKGPGAALHSPQVIAKTRATYVPQVLRRKPHDHACRRVVISRSILANPPENRMTMRVAE